MMRFTFVLIKMFIAICAISALCLLTPGATAETPAPPQDAAKSVCDLPKEVGPCRKSDLVYYHNAATKQCEEFLYGGCLGNDNRFHTKAECERACAVLPVTAKPIEVAAASAAVTTENSSPATASGPVASAGN